MYFIYIYLYTYRFENVGTGVHIILTIIFICPIGCVIVHRIFDESIRYE